LSEENLSHSQVVKSNCEKTGLGRKLEIAGWIPDKKMETFHEKTYEKSSLNVFRDCETEKKNDQV